MGFDAVEIVASLIKIAIVLVFLLQITPVMAWVERRGAGLIQDRPGPNRVGPFGLIQALADALKFIFKEDNLPGQSNKVLFTLAPVFGLIPAVTTFAVIPFARGFTVPATLDYSGTLGGIFLGVAAVSVILAFVIARATASYSRGPEALSVSIWIGRLVWVVLLLVAVLLVAATLWLKSVGSLALPGAGYYFDPIVADLDIGILLIFALSSLGVYGLATAGWSSNNKYSLIGGIRASAQMISYELALTLSAVGVLLAAGSLSLTDVVERQTGYFILFETIKIPAWNVFPMFIGFIVFWVAAFAETNRLPFDFAEAEAELVAGYHTEYSSMKFALFFMAEYMAMGTISALLVTLFLGGWDIPWYTVPPTFVGFLLSFVSFLVKIAILMLIFVWVRWTLPRLRFDLLMRLGWKVFLPLALLNIVLVAILIPLGWV
jgi:NADH:ubiquinone oxidoreductase subunit H